VGTASSAVAWGGENPYDVTYHDDTESWDGTSWSAEGLYPENLSRMAGAGTQSAALSYGGWEGANQGVNTYTFNGTNWAQEANLNFQISQSASCGTQSAAICAGGASGSEDETTQLWDGTSWTQVADMNKVRLNGPAAAGTTAAATILGSTFDKTAETWDGTSWSNITSAPENKGYHNGSGTADDCMFTAGYESTTKTFIWNGVSWEYRADVNQERFLARAGSNSLGGSHTALLSGGTTTGNTPLSHCEQYGL